MRKTLDTSPRSLKWQNHYTAICSANDAQNSCNTLLNIPIVSPHVNSKSNAQYFDTTKNFCTFVYGECYILLARDIWAVLAY